MIGHLMSGAGSVEFVSTVMSIFTRIVPPTINYSEPDDECDLNYVINGTGSIDLDAAMTNSFGFGGGNASLVIKRYSEASNYQTGGLDQASTALSAGIPGEDG